MDIGGIYYFGFIREPVIEIPEADPTDYSIHFDRLNLFGLEFATVVGGFNLRAEAAYNMTEDFDGDDPYIHNHTISYMGGFDRDLPLSNLNVNIQGRGEYLLANDEVSDNGSADVDYDSRQERELLDQHPRGKRRGQLPKPDDHAVGGSPPHRRDAGLRGPPRCRVRARGRCNGRRQRIDLRR